MVCWGQNTSPGTPCTTLFRRTVRSFTSRRMWTVKELRDAAYGLSSLSKKTREFSHLQVKKERRQHFLFSHFKWVLVRLGFGLSTSSTLVRHSTNWANRSTVNTKRSDWLVVRVLPPLRQWSFLLDHKQWRHKRNEKKMDGNVQFLPTPIPSSLWLRLRLQFLNLPKVLTTPTPSSSLIKTSFFECAIFRGGLFFCLITPN